MHDFGSMEVLAKVLRPSFIRIKKQLYPEVPSAFKLVQRWRMISQ
jgi:hypothetical protein